MGMSGTCAGIYKYGVGIIWGSSYELPSASEIIRINTEDGEKISFDVPMIANSREDTPEKRTFHEKFTLRSREYKYGDKYYLVLADVNDEKNILQQYEFMIDIAFVDDFGF